MDALTIGDIIITTPRGVPVTRENLRTKGIRGLVVLDVSDGSLLVRVRVGIIHGERPEIPLFISDDELTAAEQNCLLPLRALLTRGMPPVDDFA